MEQLATLLGPLMEQYPIIGAVIILAILMWTKGPKDINNVLDQQKELFEGYQKETRTIQEMFQKAISDQHERHEESVKELRKEHSDEMRQQREDHAESIQSTIDKFLLTLKRERDRSNEQSVQQENRFLQALNEQQRFFTGKLLKFAEGRKSNSNDD